MAVQKGRQCGGCCCGGCSSPPRDLRGPTVGELPQFSIQSLCCSCLPNQICVQIVEDGAYDESWAHIERACDKMQPAGGGPLQFSGNVWYDGELHLFNLYLELRPDGNSQVCWVLWEIDSLGWSGEKLINHNLLTTSYDCDLRMKSEDCATFGGEWQVTEAITLIISTPETVDLAEAVECGGCGCVCDCICLSIWSRDAAETIEFTGQNAIVCAQIDDGMRQICAAGDPLKLGGFVFWELDGWQLRINGGTMVPPDSFTLIAGTSTLACNLQDTLTVIDEWEHLIDATAGGAAEVEYQWDIDDRMARRLQWAGISNGNLSKTEFFGWNWATSQWDLFGEIEGRQSGQIERTFRQDLSDDFTGTGANLGIVKVKIKSRTAQRLRNDQLLLQTTRCCEIELIPPYYVVPSSPLEKLNLAQVGQCPSPHKFWNFTDTSGIDWTVAFECLWCGGRCGTSITSCCPRPIPAVVFAEILIDCPPCGAGLTVPLQNISPSIWEGVGLHCGSPLSVRFSCSGSSWYIEVEGAGACSFRGFATTTDCDPLNVTFSGDFSGGLGCCGTQENGQNGAPITIVVIE